MAAPRLRLVKPKDSGVIVVQPHTRSRTQWTPALIRNAEISADGGDMRLVGELCEWLLGDELIARLLHQRAQALLAKEPTFERSGDRRSSGRVVRALEAGEDWFDGWPESTLTQIVVWGILAGLAVARQSWEEVPGHGERVLPLPQIWDIQHTRYDFQRRTWLARVVSGDSAFGFGAEEPFAAGDGTWILHTPHGPDKPHRRGLWRGLARFRLLRDWGTSDLGHLGEGVSREVIEADKEVQQTKDLRQELADDLLTLGRDAKIVLPPGLTYKLASMAQGAVTVFDKQFEISERAITIAIRGGNLTTNVEGGSRAAAEVQERLGDQANLAFDAQTLTTTIHDQSLVHWAEFNFGSGELAPWPVYPVEPEEDLKAKTEGEEKAFTVVEKAEQLGFEVDRKAFLAEHKITWAKPGKAPETPKLPVPGAPPAPGQLPPAPVDPENAPPKDTAPRALAGIRLSSGPVARGTTGFVSGQLYTDSLAEEGVRAAEAPLEAVRAIIREELDQAQDYEDLRQRLRARFEDLDGEELNEIVFRVMALGELAGRAAVNEDA